MWYGYGGGMGWGDGLWWGHILFHGIFGLIVLVGVVAVLVWAARSLGGGHGQRSPGSDALAILEARYARGEIGRDEYLEKKNDLAR